MAALYGADITRKRLSELGNETLRASLKQTYDAVVAARTFHYVRGRYIWPDHAVEIERLLVPMSGGDGRLSTILGIVLPANPAEHSHLLVGAGAATLQIDETITGKALTPT